MIDVVSLILMHINQNVLAPFDEYQVIYVLDSLQIPLINALLTCKKKEALFNSIQVTLLLLYYLYIATADKNS